jgi:membrane-associated protease RseP (regulator of RpoE activity)
MDGVLARPRLGPRQAALHLGLFLATVVTTVWAGFAFSPDAPSARTPGDVVLAGLPFALSVVAILGTHEMGHYVLARRYGVDATLPYFIPFPLGFGTLGAVIRIRSRIPTRRAVFDIGVAGPLAGFAVALPLLAWGLSLSEVRAVEAIPSHDAASPLAILRAWIEGRALAEGNGAVTFMGDSVLTWAVGRLVVGPLPPGHDVFIHPVGLAAWLGLLVTTLNLVPAGQLDGGHVLYALFGRERAERLSRLTTWALLGAGLAVSFTWLVWWVIVRFVVGRGHPPALVEEPLGPGRRALGWGALLLFALTFVPVPLSF